MIPNVIHFIFGLKENFGDIDFSFIHYLAIKSAYECNHPESIKFYYKYEPKGPWWEKSKPYLTLIKIEPPKEIFGNPILYYAHQADVLRLEILIKEGGIYLDMDVICLNSFGPLLQYDCVMGMEDIKGLSNAIILAKPNSPFLRKWYEGYRTFRSKGKDEFLVEHSVELPLKLAKENSHMIHIEDEFSFCWPPYFYTTGILWDRPTGSIFDKFLFELKKTFSFNFLKSSYCIHLWESLWWDEYLKDISLESVMKSNDNFSKLCRNYLGTGNKFKENSFLSFARPFLKKWIKHYLRYDLRKQ